MAGAGRVEMYFAQGGDGQVGERVLVERRAVEMHGGVTCREGDGTVAGDGLLLAVVVELHAGRVAYLVGVAAAVGVLVEQADGTVVLGRSGFVVHDRAGGHGQ